VAEDKSQKTEKATPKRRKEARDEGNIARTPDLSAWLTVLVFVVLGPMTAQRMADLFVSLMRHVSDVIGNPDVGLIQEGMKAALLGGALVVAPLLVATMVAGTLGQIAQVGFRITAKRFKPKWRVLNPGAGLKQLFTAHSAWTLAKTLVKFVAFGLAAYQIMSGAVGRITSAGSWSLGALLDVAQSAAMDLLRVFVLLGLVIAAADYAMERMRVAKTLKMSKDEIKREGRQSEGDPHMKGAMRSRQREMGRRRMMAEVGTASVVMVNPAHVAVALRYLPGEGAPQVVAKGSGYIAQRIREEAEAAEVPMVRDVILARALYKMCEVGERIPVELYDAIAQILAFVMRLAEQGRATGAHTTPIRHPTPLGGALPEDLTDEALGLSDRPPTGVATAAA
jgi:flagellar biosynthetic protein FlhB